MGKKSGHIFFLPLFFFIPIFFFAHLLSAAETPAMDDATLQPDREEIILKTLERMARKEAFHIKPDISGYVKSLNFLTSTTGTTPELIHNPFAAGEKNQRLFQTLERARIKIKLPIDLPLNERLLARIDYDHQAFFGSYVGSGDFRYAKRINEERQLVDVSQTLVEKKEGFYEHRLYRASLDYQTKFFNVEIGRQQISWGVGYFFTPTDIFNSFQSTQLELDERDGVDALNFTTKSISGTKAQFVYTPRGKRLHPQRFMGRISHDILGYETGVLGGFVHRDFVSGFDVRGNLKDSAVRSELLYTHTREDKDFVQFTANADYNFPHNVYGMLEYHFNGLGKFHRRDYQDDRLIQNQIAQLAKNYLAAIIGHDFIPSILRLEGRTIFNLTDQSIFLRPELQYSLTTNTLLTAGAHLFFGAKENEFGRARDLYFCEAKNSF